VLSSTPTDPSCVAARCTSLLPLSALGSFLPDSQGPPPGLQQKRNESVAQPMALYAIFLGSFESEPPVLRQAASLEVSKDRPFIDNFLRVHSRFPVSQETSAKGLAAPFARSVLEVSHLFDGLRLVRATSLLHLALDLGVHRVSLATKQDSRCVFSTLRSVPSARSIAPTSCPVMTSGSCHGSNPLRDPHLHQKPSPLNLPRSPYISAGSST